MRTLVLKPGLKYLLQIVYYGRETCPGEWLPNLRISTFFDLANASASRTEGIDPEKVFIQESLRNSSSGLLKSELS